MGKIIRFFKECIAELKKVVWPSRNDAVSSVKVVFSFPNLDLCVAIITSSSLLKSVTTKFTGILLKLSSFSAFTLINNFASLFLTVILFTCILVLSVISIF